MFYVDKGQELCIIYGLHFCNVYIEKVVLARNTYETQVRVKKRVRSPGYGVFLFMINIILKISKCTGHASLTKATINMTASRITSIID